jgi:lipopolysaccharide biosynthesis regulator YciM
VEIFITQNRSVHLPMVLLVLAFVLLGVFITTIINWVGQFKSAWKRSQKNFRDNKNQKRLKHFEQLYQKGKNSLTAGQLDKAQNLFERILEKHPNHPGALLHLGDIMSRTGKQEKALELHSQAASQAPDNIKILIHLAEDYAAAGRTEKEQATLEKIKRISAGSTDLLSKLRDSYVKGNDLVQALAVQKRIVSLTNDLQEQKIERKYLSELIYTKGSNHVQKGQMELAGAEFKKAIRADNQTLPAYIALGELHLASGNQKAAVKIWRDAFQKTQSPVSLLKLESLYKASDNSDAMVKMYQEALDKTPSPQKNILELLLARLLLEGDDAKGAIQRLEGNHDGELLRGCFLAKAYQETADATSRDQMLQSAFDYARISLTQFICGKCHTPFKEWKDRCPECDSWNTLSLSQTKPHVH